MKQALVVFAVLFNGCSCIIDPILVTDAGLNDAGSSMDAGADAGNGTDAGSTTDAGTTDAGDTDAGVTDAGVTDAGAIDAGTTDAGTTDAGSIDAGLDGGVLTTRTVDVLIIGAGAGGIAAALQASRLGRTVALLEETAHVGGQLLSVTSMDESTGSIPSYPEREGGIYGEFNQRIRARYGARPVGTCYWSNASLCYEAADGEAVLRQMLAERQLARPEFTLQTRTRVLSVQRDASGTRVTGAITDDGMQWLSKILIDATEYGDVMPLAQVPYRVGNSEFAPARGLTPDLNGCVQNITATLSIRFYDGGLPAALDLRNVDAGSDYGSRAPNFVSIVRDDPGGGTTVPGAWSWTYHALYRGTPDRDNPRFYDASLDGGISKTMINALNDYPTILTLADAGYSVRAVEDRAFRREEECRARLLTLQFLHYGQTTLGADWGASDESAGYGYVDPCDPAIMPAGFAATERFFPHVPYVRESRRVLGVRTISARDIFREPAPGVNTNFASVGHTRYETSLALGYYYTDLHGCWGDNRLESSLELKDAGSGGGPFQIPMGTMIPSEMDGFLVAEKNLSQTRMANGATRLQPTCMLTGQAVGTIAALSVARAVQPRVLPPVLVQRALLDAGVAISVYRYQDVAHASSHWGDAQLASTYGIMASTTNFTFGETSTLTRGQAAVVLQRTLRYPLPAPRLTPTFADVPSTNPFHRFVEAMADQGLSAGCGGGLFCPDTTVTRAQLAVFLMAGLKEPPGSCANATPWPDVLSNHFACPAIARLKAIGVAAPCNGGSGFCPDAVITRGEAAAFAGNALEYMAGNPTDAGTCYRTPPDFCGP